MAESNAQPSVETEPVAIVGMAGRFPGAPSVAELWRNLREGKESIRFFREDELDPALDRSTIGHPDYVKARGMLPDADGFDAALFGISPREARMMDPQHRLFLEASLEALEDAGCNPRAYRGLIGVYGGTGFNTYLQTHLGRHPDLVESFGEHQTSLGNAPDYVTTRVSYKLNLRGPALSLYTGCSLSLVAVCVACDHLLTSQCDLALAGGAFVWCPLRSGYLYREGEIFAKDGHCRPFDAKASGTVFGNGVGIVALKRLSDARADGDRIYAVIRGTGLNNDGSKKASFTAPNVDGQAEAIAMAHANAGVDPATIGYVETHGTGTPVGDPAEIAALTQAFRLGTTATGFCAIGSIKANIGHLDAAAGVAGLIKTALALHHGAIPPSINFDEPNPCIAFEETPFFVNTRLTEWKAGPTPRRAGVSSFGVGGTNAHAVLEEAPVTAPSDSPHEWSLLAFSAAGRTALNTLTAKLAEHLEQHPDLNLTDAAYTLQTGRQPLKRRRIAVCKDHADAVAVLRATDEKRLPTALVKDGGRDVAFMFTGQGSQYANMGLGLYRTQAVFRQQFDRCAAFVADRFSLDLKRLVYPADGDLSAANEALKQTAATQPALFAVEYALAQLWISWGIVPTVLAGHSVGEYPAACLAGVFSLEDGLSLIVERGRLMQGMAPGAMLAVPLPPDEVTPLLSDRLALATINAPTLCVVSGPDPDIEAFAADLTARNVACRPLHTSHAFHSPMMEPMLDDFAERVRRVALHPPGIPLLSNVTGTRMTAEEAVDPATWVRHVRRTVRFADNVAELLKEPDRVLLEIGPGPTLGKLAARHPAKTREQVILSSLPHAEEQAPDTAHILGALGQLWLSGVEIRWEGLYAGETRRRASLPTYPFQRKRYWAGVEDADANDDTPEDDGDTGNGSARTYVAPATEAERKLADIWRSVLGVGRIGVDDNFFDLGGHSLLAVSVMQSVEKAFGKRLPLATLVQAPTMRLFTAFLGDARERGWSPLVPLQTAGAAPPLFLMHSHGGNILEYYPLAKRLGTDRPIYALQSEGIDGRPFGERTIEEMATCYLKEIRSVQPRGPYYLAGFCFGGYLAVEAARQLRAAGERVALVALFDSRTPAYLMKLPGRSGLLYLWDALAYRMELEWGNLMEHSLGTRIPHALARGRRFLNLARARIEAGFDQWMPRRPEHAPRHHSVTHHLEQLAAANDRAWEKYAPPVYDGDVLFVAVSRQPSGIRPDPMLGWSPFLTGSVKDHVIHGFRQNLLSEPAVDRLAALLRDALDRGVEEAGKA